MGYLDLREGKVDRKEYQREWVRKRRGVDTKVETVDKVGVSVDSSVGGVDKVRLNPRTGKAYGTSMLGLLGYPKGAECLKEYEKKYGQTEGVYGERNKYDFLAEYGTSEKFKRIVSSLGDLSGEVRIGAFGPTIQELADTIG